MPDQLVSIVIPAYNPASYLLEAIASARAQTHPRTEIILVNDGSDQRESLAILEQASRLVSAYIEQPNRGLGAARNTGFRAAHGERVVPLDADDLIQPGYVSDCLTAMSADAAYVYTDYLVFGNHNYRQDIPDYNFYQLLDRNFLTYAALIKKAAWEEANGYDESMRLGYEDWEFWLRLGSLGLFGKHVRKPLFQYRKQGASMYDNARAHHPEIVAYIQGRHPELYQYEKRAGIKARWSPAVSIMADEPPTDQTIEDIQLIAPGEAPLAPVVLDATNGPLDPEAAELAALASWGGRNRTFAAPPGRNTLHRHLLNAELLSARSWTRHPARSLSRLIPLRLKEHINHQAGRPIFDLSFYLQFQTNSLVFGDAMVEPLIYYPKPAQGKKRVALLTPHLGPGGAESVLYDIASTFCSDRFETLLLATQSRDDSWLAKWRERVDHVYDLAKAVPSEKMTAALCSIITNWRCDTVVIQNSLYGYAAIPHLKKMQPECRIIDVIHSLDNFWDLVAATADVASEIDVRVAMSEALHHRLGNALLVRNGVDLERFQPAPLSSNSTKNILFAARLDPVKRPLLVPDIAKALLTLRPQRDFRFVIAGDGPEKERFTRRVSKLGLDAEFDFRGQVNDLAPLYAASDIVLLPSRSEGVPLVILEALACARPVVASKAGSIPEAVDSSCGILIEQFDTAHAAAEFARAIHSLLDQPELRAKMGAAGRRKMEASHDIRKTREAFASLFDQGSSVSVASTNRSTAME
jgi:glycosyltransferase involved in cell wall biosynthesis/GT2 family glycosyltransferase